MQVGERKPNFSNNREWKSPSSPPKRGACGVLTIDPKENSLWKEISKLSSKNSIGIEGGKRDFLQIKSKDRTEGLQQGILQKGLLVWISFCQVLYIWFLIYTEFPNLLRLSTLSHLSFFLNYNSAFPCDQHSCYIQIQISLGERFHSLHTTSL